MRFIRETNIDFIGKRKPAFLLSAAFIAVGLVSVLVRGGIDLGVDFTGGVQVEVGITPRAGSSVGPVRIEMLRDAVASAGFDNRNIQRAGGGSGNTFLIHVESTTSGEEVSGTEAGGAQTSSDRILEKLRENSSEYDVEMLQVQSVGPKIGAELRLAAIQAVLLATLLIMAYVAWRFEFRFGVTTIAAIAHDVILTLGLFSLLNKELTLSVVAAFLTLVGYSVNDTIVVFDRIREELKIKQRRESYESIFNSGINKTLERTLLTSFTTLLVLGALFFYGGEVIHDFTWVLLIGVLVGTYSSVFIAAPLVVVWHKRAAAREGTGTTRAA